MQMGVTREHLEEERGSGGWDEQAMIWTNRHVWFMKEKPRVWASRAKAGKRDELGLSSECFFNGDLTCERSRENNNRFGKADTSL